MSNHRMYPIMFAVFIAAVSTPSKSTAAPTIVPLDQSRWSWIKEKWTGNDVPYHRMRNHIDSLSTLNKLNKGLIQKYKTLALRHRHSPQDQFRWTYASYRVAVTGTMFGNQQLADASRYLFLSPSPRTYNYARLRFLVEARAFPYRQLRYLGQRLLRQQSNDPEVKFHLVGILDPGRSTSEKKEALSLAHDLVRTSPSRPSVHSCLGGVYYKSWLVSHSQEDAKKAIASYNVYLKLAKPDDPFRKQAHLLIKLMNDGRRSIQR